MTFSHSWLAFWGYMPCIQSIIQDYCILKETIVEAMQFRMISNVKYLCKANTE